MKYLVKPTLCINGREQTSTPFELDYHYRTLILSGEIDNESAAILCSSLRALSRDSKEDIYLYLNSPGGSVSAGLSILDTMNAIENDINTIATGQAASMAVFLLANGTKGKRWIQPNAEVLIHQPLGNAAGQASDIRIHAEHILKTRQKLNKILSDCTGQTIEKIELDTERDKIMDAETAIEYGIVDRIGDPISEF